MTKTRFYYRYRGMFSRTTNKDNPKYKNYGARGIKVCDRWLKFENFKLDMYETYLSHIKKFGEKDTSIDRINNDGNYEPTNCRWATFKEQSNNTRANRLLTFNGQTMTMTEWEEKLNFRPNTLHNRISTYKWSIKKALTTPIKKIEKERYCIKENF